MIHLILCVLSRHLDGLLPSGVFQALITRQRGRRRSAQRVVPGGYLSRHEAKKTKGLSETWKPIHVSLGTSEPDRKWQQTLQSRRGPLHAPRIGMQIEQ